MPVMDVKKKSWQEHEALAQSYKAIGQTTIYLSDYDGPKDRPWELVTRCEAGSTHRLEISTSVNFYATSKSGLEYRWSFDIEGRDANGQGYYMIMTGEIKRVMALLPAPARASFRAYLAECAKAVRIKADEWNEMVTRQYGTVVELEKLGRGSE